jgi:hypothetical protein
MIMGTDEPREIGKTYTRPLHIDGVLYPDQPVFIIREVPFEEWRKGIEQCPLDPVEARAVALGDHARRPVGPKIWWYEVSTD